VAKSIADCCGVAIVAAISPYKADRDRAKELIGADRFFEVFVNCHIDTLIERDVKGLYAKAISGEIPNFTGISDPYECPERPHCIVNSGTQTIEESLNIIKDTLNTFLEDNEKEIMYYI
jgi:adenylylsulfate kinase-like enzyme